MRRDSSKLSIERSQRQFTAEGGRHGALRSRRDAPSSTASFSLAEEGAVRAEWDALAGELLSEKRAKVRLDVERAALEKRLAETQAHRDAQKKRVDAMEARLAEERARGSSEAALRAKLAEVDAEYAERRAAYDAVRPALAAAAAPRKATVTVAFEHRLRARRTGENRRHCHALRSQERRLSEEVERLRAVWMEAPKNSENGEPTVAAPLPPMEEAQPSDTEGAELAAAIARKRAEIADLRRSLARAKAQGAPSTATAAVAEDEERAKRRALMMVQKEQLEATIAQQRATLHRLNEGRQQKAERALMEERQTMVRLELEEHRLGRDIEAMERAISEARLEPEEVEQPIGGVSVQSTEEKRSLEAAISATKERCATIVATIEDLRASTRAAEGVEGRIAQTAALHKQLERELEAERASLLKRQQQLPSLTEGGSSQKNMIIHDLEVANEKLLNKLSAMKATNSDLSERIRRAQAALQRHNVNLP